MTRHGKNTRDDYLGAGCAMAASFTGLGRRVTTIAGFQQRVGSETQAHFASDNVVNNCGVIPRVEVVDELCSFVTEETCVFEFRGALHTAKSSGSRLNDVVPSEAEVDRLLNNLGRVDAEIGSQAQKNVLRYRVANNITEDTYVFPVYKSAEERKVWVHRWWVRPLRFFYRHLPTALRSRIKKVAT